MPTREQAGLDMTAITDEEWSAAQRLADAVNLHVMADRAQRDQRTTPPYIAIDLKDGRCPDGTLYPSRAEATRHQKSPERFYVKIGPATMSPREALILLMYARRAFKAGVVFSEEEPVAPQRLELAAPFIPRTLSGMRRPRG